MITGARSKRRRPRRGVRIALATAVVAALIAVAAAVWTYARRDIESLDVLRARATEAIAAGRFDAAGALLERIERRATTPTASDILLRAQYLVARGRPDDAIALARTIDDADPLAAQARLLEGRVELRRDRVRFAERALLKAAALDPKLVPPRRELIVIYGMRTQRREVEEQFAALSRIDMLSFDNVLHWSLLHGVVWDPAEVEPDLARYVAADPDDRVSRLALADCLRQLNRFDEAEKTLRTLSNDDADARAIRARIAFDQHRDEAFDRLVEGGPRDHPGLALLRGKVALSRRDAAEAERCYRIAWQANPDDREAVFGLGRALLMLGRAVEAKPLLDKSRGIDEQISLLQRVLAPDGRNPQLVRALGAACAAVDRLDEARGWYNLAISRDPLDVEAQRAVFRIDARIRARDAAKRANDVENRGEHP